MATVDFTQRPLHEQTFLFFGAGMASVGCAELLVLAMRRSGLTDAQARGRIWMMDSKGLLVKSRPVAEISKEKLAFVQEGPVHGCAHRRWRPWRAANREPSHWLPSMSVACAGRR